MPDYGNIINIKHSQTLICKLIVLFKNIKFNKKSLMLEDA